MGSTRGHNSDPDCISLAHPCSSLVHPGLHLAGGTSSNLHADAMEGSSPAAKLASAPPHDRAVAHGLPPLPRPRLRRPPRPSLLLDLASLSSEQDPSAGDHKMAATTSAPSPSPAPATPHRRSSRQPRLRAAARVPALSSSHRWMTAPSLPQSLHRPLVALTASSSGPSPATVASRPAPSPQTGPKAPRCRYR